MALNMQTVVLPASLLLNYGDNQKSVIPFLVVD